LQAEKSLTINSLFTPNQENVTEVTDGNSLKRIKELTPKTSGVFHNLNETFSFGRSIYSLFVREKFVWLLKDPYSVCDWLKHAQKFENTDWLKQARENSKPLIG